MAHAQTPNAPIDETNIGYALAQAFDRAALPLPDGQVPATLSAGVVRIGPLAIDGASSASATYDLRAQSLAMEIDLAAPASGKFWSGPPPTVAVSLSGGFDAPARRIDARRSPRVLPSQAIARETDRISALEADIRERAYFNRRLKAEKFMRQREAELAAYAADQARLKADEDRKRAAEEAAKAAQAPPMPPPLPPPTRPTRQPFLTRRRPLRRPRPRRRRSPRRGRRPAIDDLTAKGIY